MNPVENNTAVIAEIRSLAEAVCTGSITPEQCGRLNSLLLDEKAALTYAVYIRMHGLLCWHWQDQVVVIETPETPPPVQLPASLLGGAWQGTVGFFSQTMPFSYLTATVILGVMLLGFWAYKITHHQHIAEAPSQSVPSDARPEMVFVGRITGMVDVKWSDDPHYLPPPGFAHVPLGRKYILDAGLMEITYDSGAKVILEGPCTYEVESTAGGYLALGKLTARVREDKETGRQGDKEKRADAASPHLLVSTSPGLPVSPLFSVRTPTAVVTDLGTEFGVEVSEEGTTESRVFAGEVRIEWVDAKDGAGQTTVLHAGQTARCDKRRGITIPAAPDNAGRFVRSLRPVTVRIVETFDGAELGAAFAQTPPGRYVNTGGAAVYQQPPMSNGRQSRGYIHTVATDFNDRDFVFEATFEVRLSAVDKSRSHYIFFGIGDGVPNANHWDEVSNGLVLAFQIDKGRTFVRLCHPDSDSKADQYLNKTVGEVTLRGVLKPGKYRFRMSKAGKWVRFTVDTECKGPFRADFHGPLIDLPATVPLLNSTNSRLLVGTGVCDTMMVRFEELSVVYTKTVREVQEMIHAGDPRATVPDGEATGGDNAQQGGRDKTDEK